MKILPPKFLAAMIAVRALPGAPLYDGDNKNIIKRSLEDLEMYKAEDVDSVVLENDHDLPYIRPPLPLEALKIMTKIAKEVRRRFKKPIGIQMLRAANIEALEIATEAKLDYLRVESFVFAHIGGDGIVEGCCGKLLRRRKELGSEHIKIFADVKKKHNSHAITADLDITDEIKQAEFYLADGIIVTSKFTGIEPKKSDLIKAKEATKLPVVIGSGMTPENIKSYLPLADGFIVGSTFRKEGRFLEEINPKRLQKFTRKFYQLRKS